LPGNFWWQERRDGGAQEDVKLIDLLINKDESEQTINIYKRPPEKGKECTDNQTDNQDVYSCSITANIFPDLHTLQGSLGGESSTTPKSHSVKIITGTAIEFRKPKLKDVGEFRNIKATDQLCFYINNLVVHGNIMIARAEHKLLFNVSPGSDGVPLRPQFSPDTSWWDSGSPTSKSARSKDDNWFITSAFAQTLPRTPYDKLRLELRSPDPNVRVRARQFLGEHFDAYANDVWSDLKVKNNDPNLIVSLLHGLITGIDKKEEGKYLPKAGRNIGTTMPLPFIHGKEDDILDLVTIDDASVKKQVRRLIQRFPYDAFRDSFMRLFEKYHIKQDCEAKKQNDTNQSLIYAFSFFTYNQMIQIALNNPLSTKVIENIEDIANQSKELAKCLDKALYIDSAIVDYGRATIYAQNKALKDRTQAAANAFLDVVKKGRSNGAEYYFNSHIDTIEQMVN
jgi:hypothetical protein